MSDLRCWRSTVVWLGIAFSALLASANAQDVQVTIHADRVVHQVSPYLAGACLEDVNHEVYGGIYSQMLFGESFQEPAFTAPPKGFQVLGDQWAIRDGELLAAGIPGGTNLKVE